MKLRSYTRVLMAMSTLSLALLGGSLASTSITPAAEARCAGYTNQDYPLSAYDPGTHTYAIASEAAWYASTCDYDNYYAGGINDPVTDGSCAYVTYHDSGYDAVQGYECTTYSWSYFSFSDTNSDNTAAFDLGTDYYTESFGYGTNYGY